MIEKQKVLMLEYCLHDAEEDYWDDNITDIFKETLGAGEGISYEADSWDLFSRHELISKRTSFFSETELNEAKSIQDNQDGVDDYFSNLVLWIQNISEHGISEQYRLEKIEQWLTIKSCKINDTNTYVMAPCHPMVQLLDCYNLMLRDTFNSKRQTTWSSMAWTLGREVLKNYLRENENFFVYETGQLYLSMRKDGCRKAVPWKNVGTLTPIHSARLIEKVKSWVVRNCEGDEIHPKVQIAYVGEIVYPDVITDYYKKYPIKKNDIDIFPEIKLIHLVQKPQIDEYTYELQGTDIEGKKIYNLSSLSDMQEIFERFQIVLFLDESYFYKQRQSSKNLYEKGAVEYVQWCLKELRRELPYLDSEEQKKRKKYYFYSQIYNRAGLWLNGYGKESTSKLEFDNSLFSTIMRAYGSREPSDIYLYISKGNSIGNVILSVQSICNDERYDGKKLLVYKVTAADDNNIEGALDEMLDESDKVTDASTSAELPILASIDLWKLVKSIGNDCIRVLLGEQDNDNIVDQIALLKHTFLNVKILKENNEKPQLQFYLQQSKEADKQQQETLQEFVRAYIKICMEKSEDKNDFVLSYVREYLYELLVSAMVARANSVEGVFYAYLLKKRAPIVERDTDIKHENDVSSPVGGNQLFRARRMIYSALCGLDQLIIKDLEKRLSILKYEFRYKYCPEVDEEQFLRLLDEINRYCLEAGYVDSRLYLLTREKGD